MKPLTVDPNAENCCRGSRDTHFSSHLHANLRSTRTVQHPWF